MIAKDAGLKRLVVRCDGYEFELEFPTEAAPEAPRAAPAGVPLADRGRIVQVGPDGDKSDAAQRAPQHFAAFKGRMPQFNAPKVD